MGTQDDDLEVLDAVTDGFVAACRCIRDDQFDGETPCSEWNVTDLVDHVTGGNRFTVGILQGHAADDALAAAVASFEGGRDPVGAAIESSQLQRAVFNEPGALDRVCSHLAGELSGSQVLRLRLHDVTIHTWDLNEAISPPARIPEALVGWSIAELADPKSLAARHMTIGGHRPPESAEELLAAFGRCSVL
jgi:uncharacterized protein (TIGR03086 family)